VNEGLQIRRLSCAKSNQGTYSSEHTHEGKQRRRIISPELRNGSQSKLKTGRQPWLLAQLEKKKGGRGMGMASGWAELVLPFEARQVGFDLLGRCLPPAIDVHAFKIFSAQRGRRCLAVRLTSGAQMAETSFQTGLNSLLPLQQEKRDFPNSKNSQNLWTERLQYFEQLLFLHLPQIRI
jgi:hypothetical protein